MNSGHDPFGNAVSRPQLYYFYACRWSQKRDKAFIHALYYQACRGHKQNTQTPNQHSLMYARDVVNYGFGWMFHFNVIKDRLERLRKRYETFNRILNTLGFVWDQARNVVLATNQNWERLCSEIDFAKAYRYEGEPAWMELV